MLTVSNLHKSYGDVTVLEGVNFTVNRGERTGLVGPNGCGKSTLLRIIVGQEQADAGSVTFTPANLRVSYLPQALEMPVGATVSEALLATDPGHEPPEQRLERIAAAMAAAQGDELEVLLHEYDRTLAELEAAGGYGRAAQAEAILAGLGLANVDEDTPVDILSGGQKTRLGLARLLLADPELLLLDEPTNHLDIQALQWLEEFLHRFEGGMLLVSHDRAFLDRIVTTILELDPLTHQATAYPGNYTDYAEVKARERERRWQAYREQQERIARVEADIRQTKQRANNIENETIHFHFRRVAKDIARTAVVRERKLRRLLESEEEVEKPERSWTMKLEFTQAPPSGQDVLRLEDVSMSFPGLPLFRNVNLAVRYGQRIALLGPNGSGKTTLLRLIRGEVQPAAGNIRLGANVKAGYYAQEQDELEENRTPLETIRAVATMSETDARSFLHYFLFAGDDVFAPVRNLSYGERARLALARLVALGCNLLLLDEPINHLDISSRASFEQALDAFPGTVIAVVHDRYFVQRFATRVWVAGHGAVREYVDLKDMLRNEEA